MLFPSTGAVSVAQILPSPGQHLQYILSFRFCIPPWFALAYVSLPCFSVSPCQDQSLAIPLLLLLLMPSNSRLVLASAVAFIITSQSSHLPHIMCLLFPSSQSYYFSSFRELYEVTAATKLICAEFSREECCCCDTEI